MKRSSHIGTAPEGALYKARQMAAAKAARVIADPEPDPRIVVLLSIV